MRSGTRAFLLAFIGAASAVLAFTISTPYVNTLKHPGIPAADPRFHFTLGTQWAVVNHWSAGAILCAGIAFVLMSDRKGFKWGLLSGMAAFLLGGVLGAGADGLSDWLGIQLMRRFGDVSFVPEIFWSVLVPTAYALVITVCIGVTVQRLKRAAYAAFWAAVWSYVATIASIVILSALVQAGVFHVDMSALAPQAGTPKDGGAAMMKASLPIWEATAVAVGFVLGAILARAESVVKAGSIILILGKNEGKEWNLDHTVNRIGSAEGVEIPVRGMANIAPVHAQIVLHEQGFAIEDHAGGVLLNGQPVQQAWLSSGDTIQIGQAVFAFHTARRNMIGPLPNAMQTAAPHAIPVLHAPAQQMPGPVAGAGARLMDPFGNMHPLRAGPNLVGRDPGCDIVVPWDNSVSRKHAQLMLNGSTAQLVDLGSSNGSFINGQRIIGSAQVNPGDWIALGNAAFQFQV